MSPRRDGHVEIAVRSDMVGTSSATSDATLRLVLSSVRVGLWEWDVLADHVEWSEHVDELFGFPPGAFGRTYEAFLATIPDDDRPGVIATIGTLIDGRADEYTMEHRIVWPDGSVRWVECKARAGRDEAGKLLRIAGTVIDSTSRKQAEIALRNSEEVIRSAMSHSPIGMSLVAPNGTFLDANPAFCELVGYTREQLLALDFQTITHPQDLAADMELLAETLAGRRMTYQLEKRYYHRDGHLIWAQLNVSLVHNPDGTPRFFISQVQDITERRTAEHALRESEETLRQLAENLLEVMWLRDLDSGRLLYLSPAFERVFKLSSAAPDRESEWLAGVHPDDRERVAKANANQATKQDITYRYILDDGTVRWIQSRCFPIRDATGRVYRAAGIAEDITERRRFEEQVQHAQKMDAFGQLAGGVAHDFNNLLAVILPHADMATRTPGLPSRAAESLQAIREAGERAATLTKQLLQLARRNVLHPRDTELNVVVAGFVNMLRRVLREDVTLRIELASSMLPVSVDANMFNQVLMNLAVNARDAMPTGGTLTIATHALTLSGDDANAFDGAQPGQYVCVEVTDTGDGIAPEHLPRVFEPFFTTKPPGKGTGLGLATVRGIIQQHRGGITMRSERGRGTSVRVLLPALERAGTADSAREPRSPRGGNETVLVVEDDRTVRATTVQILEQHGYHVLRAVDGADALRVIEERTVEIPLVITDLVMPGPLSGRDLVARLRDGFPSTKLLLMSGYSSEVFGHDLQLRDGETFLAKPVNVEQLLEAVRTSLDRTS